MTSSRLQQLILISCSICTLISIGSSQDTSESNNDTSTVNSSVDHITLRSVIVITNEGLATPQSTFSFIDPQLRPEFWPEGQPVLTNLGKHQLNQLGESLRKRYSSFLSDSPREVYARSADEDSNIETALVLLNGAYKAHGRWRYGNSDYLPIPVHTVPTPDDCMLSIHCNCPRRKEIWDDLLNSPEIEKYKKDFESILKLVETKTRLTSLYSQIDYVETALLQVYQKTLVPSWITPGVTDDLKDLANEFHSMAVAYPAMLKSYVGELYNELVKKLKAATNTNNRRDTSQKPKFLVYSTFTPQMSSVAYDLAGINGEIPHPATSFIIELFEAPGSSFFVKLYYWQFPISREPELVYANFTQSSSSPSKNSVPLNDLLTHLQRLTESDWKAYCGLGDSVDSGLDTLSVVLIIILCIVFASVA